MLCSSNPTSDSTALPQRRGEGRPLPKWMGPIFALIALCGLVLAALNIAHLFGPVGSSGFIVSLSCGGAIFLGSLIVIALSCQAPKRKTERSPIRKEIPRKISTTLPSPITTSSPTKKSRKLSDGEIIKNLEKQGYVGPFEEGGGGRCLFFSIVPQITQTDIDQVDTAYNSYFHDWGNLSKEEQADRLRQVALAEEAEFMKNLDTNNLDAPAQVRIRELWKDMKEELEHLGHFKISRLFASTSIVEMGDYCKREFDRYKSNTERSTNWAGTSELIAIGRIFKRQVIAFGQDFASGDNSHLDEQDHVLPYFSTAKTALSPIVIFQCHGGGHYKRLVPPAQE